MQHKQKLQDYTALLKQWGQTINLVSRNTLDDIESRHIQDSQALIQHLPKKPCRIADLGSGAGLPGLIISICTDHHVTMIESDQKKCAFIRHVIGQLGLNAEVICQRIETAPKQMADVVTARALASLDKLIGYCMFHVKQSGQMLFLKGETLTQEIETAKKQWTFNHEFHKNQSHTSDGYIVSITDVSNGRNQQ